MDFLIKFSYNHDTFIGSIRYALLKNICEGIDCGGKENLELNTSLIINQN